ncbi:MAG TPA: hypothetical protein VLR71_12945 [Casimicrobiaceae bacterium]|nr:hypothetical protein [Casimicrobiaceae bacterium]
MHDADGDQHAEWLLDEAIENTFPASDPVAAAQPGSVVSRAYALQTWRRRPAPRNIGRGFAWTIALAAGAIVSWRVVRAWERGRREGP